MQTSRTESGSESGSRPRLLTRAQARLLLPLGAAMALSLTGDSTIYAVLANQIDTVGIGLGVVGVLLGANRMIRIPGNLLAGVLNDRLGRRRLFLLGLGLGILSTLSYSLAHGFWPLLGGRILWGMAWALINVGGYTMILDASTPADRGRMTGVYQFAFMLGLTISPLLGGTLTDALGFRPALRVCAAVSAAGLGIALAALPETGRPPVRPRPSLWSRLQRQQVAALQAAWRRVDRRILLASSLYMLTFFVSSGILMPTVSLYLKQHGGTEFILGTFTIGVASLAGAMLALRAVMGMVAGPLAGVLSDRLHSRWPVVRGACLLGAGGFLVLALVARLWAVPAGVAAVALSAVASATALAALVGDLAAGSHQGLTMGGMATAGDIGSAAGPPLAYALAVSLDLRWVYLMCAAALVLGFAATFAPVAGERSLILDEAKRSEESLS
jgi:DHA1 family inner membrane transport protein